MTSALTAFDLKALEKFLQANSLVDWRARSLSDPSFVESLPSPAGTDQQALLPGLKAYQRLLAILPPEEDRRALRLLEKGLHSAIQIAGLPRAELAALWEELFPGEAELGEQVRRNAVARRSQLALEHIKSTQSSEPHYLAARFR